MKTPMNIYNTAMKKKKNRKGFSLVELIVVLVIMAILVAALVPSLVGYIRQARQSNAKDAAASAVSAAQTIASSAYADPDLDYHNNSTAGDVDFSSVSAAFTAGGTETDCSTVTHYIDAVEELAEVDGVTVIKLKGGVVSALTYSDGTTTVNYANGTYTVS